MKNGRLGSGSVMKLNDAHLADYCESFFGYGSWDAPIWFIGIEEGGGNDISTIAARIQTWHERGGRPLESALEFHSALGITKWHGNNAKLQTTWKQLIRMFLIAQGKPDSYINILDHQRTHLGTVGGGTCLIELFPLPSPNIETWNYGTWSRLPWLQTRADYKQHLLASRIDTLSKKVDLHRPPVVVFYGSTQLENWQKIIGPGTYDRPILNKLIAHKRDGTTFYVVKHPAARQLSHGCDDYFREIGDYLYRCHAKLWA